MVIPQGPSIYSPPHLMAGDQQPCGGPSHHLGREAHGRDDGPRELRSGLARTGTHVGLGPRPAGRRQGPPAGGQGRGQGGGGHR